jgi:tetratricopeptide (TPR) repeat protein
LSKVSKLKQAAYQASKKRDWDKVITLFERILEVEKNNPALINELGDTYLKRGQIARAVEHFLSAAEKYRVTGLLNNAVAIYKKVLRFDVGNLSAHWFLAELRAGQGLAGDAVEHALTYLAASERIPPDHQEGYLKRCVKLLGVLPGQPAVLERLRELFAARAQPLEASRCDLLLACLRYDAGDTEGAEAAVAALLAAHEGLADLPEHVAWRRRHGEPDGAAAYADVNSIRLGPEPDPVAAARGAEAGASATGGMGVRSEATSARADQGGGSLADSLGLVDFGGAGDGAPAEATVAGGAGISFDDLGDDASGSAARTESPDAQRFEIPLGDVPSFDDLARELAGLSAPAARGEDAAAAAGAGAGRDDAPIDLLAEILADESREQEAADARQIDTIASEIGQQVGGAAADPAGQYDLGLVYLEMEMLGQAADCFEAAVAAPEFALRSYEMWGIVLIRQSRFEEAVDVLGRGLRIQGADKKDLLGLLYRTAEAYEGAGRHGAAREYYERVYQTSPGFLDTEKRLEALESR